LKIWRDGKKAVRTGKIGKYAKRSLDFTESEQNVHISFVKDGEAHSIPREIIPLKKKIIYTPLVYKIGMILFKKGGKMRAFLKKKL